MTAVYWSVTNDDKDNTMISVGYDSESYMGIGEPSEHPEVFLGFPDIPDEPCLKCELRTSCEKSCKAFRSYVASGKFKDEDIGRILKDLA